MRRSSLGWSFSQAASCCAGSRWRTLSHLRVRRRGSGGCLCDALDRADECHEVGFADDLQVTLGGTADRRLVEPRQGRTAVGLAQRAGMQDVLGQDIVHEGGTAQLCRQVDARHAVADDAIGRDGFHRRRSGGRLRQVDLAGNGPVILSGRGAILQELAVDHGEVVAAAVEAKRGALQRLGPHLGADQAHRAARHFDRQRRRRVELVRTVGRVARQHDDAVERQVELLGGDLADGGDDALPHLDLAGGDAHGAVGLETDPAVEPRIV